MFFFKQSPRFSELLVLVMRIRLLICVNVCLKWNNSAEVDCEF